MKTRDVQIPILCKQTNIKCKQLAQVSILCNLQNHSTEFKLNLNFGLKHLITTQTSIHQMDPAQCALFPSGINQSGFILYIVH